MERRPRLLIIALQPLSCKGVLRRRLLPHDGPCSLSLTATLAAASVAAARAAGSETSAVAATSAISRALRQLQEYWLFMCSAGLVWNRSGSKSTLRRGPQLHRHPRLGMRRNQLEVLH